MIRISEYERNNTISINFVSTFLSEYFNLESIVFTFHDFKTLEPSSGGRQLKNYINFIYLLFISAFI